MEGFYLFEKSVLVLFFCLGDWVDGGVVVLIVVIVVGVFFFVIVLIIIWRLFNR